MARGLHAQNGQSDATGGWFWPVDLPNTCPICFSRLAGDQNVIRQHISRCLRQVELENVRIGKLLYNFKFLFIMLVQHSFFFTCIENRK